MHFVFRGIVLKEIVSFIKRETVLTVALVLAVVSCFFVPPSAEYLSYINFRVLVLLFCLMTVVAGMVRVGAFDVLCRMLGRNIKSTRGMYLLLTMLCFFMSMFLTNDVTLITVVPFTFILLGETGMQDGTMIILILETLAANLGSMLTPFGNPQNLFLYTKYNVGAAEFISIMLPYTVTSLMMLTGQIMFMKNRSLEIHNECIAAISDKRRFFVYLMLFVLAILSVARVIDYRILLCCTVAVTILLDRKLFAQVDYSLLLTFVFFFVFVGNMGKIRAVSETLSSLLSGRVICVSVIASQFISNVPAALLLSDFTDDYRGLMIGTDIGGLGTLIASMASLISYKFFAERYNGKKGRYILKFTFWNIVYLAVLSAVAYAMRNTV